MASGKASSKTRQHPPKRFKVPTDIARLGRAGMPIVNAMRREYMQRMTGRNNSADNITAEAAK